MTHTIARDAGIGSIGWVILLDGKVVTRVGGSESVARLFAKTLDAR